MSLIAVSSCQEPLGHKFSNFEGKIYKKWEMLLLPALLRLKRTPRREDGLKVGTAGVLMGIELVSQDGEHLGSY